MSGGDKSHERIEARDRIVELQQCLLVDELDRQELGEALDQIENDPLFGTIFRGRTKVYRRILMPKTRYHLFYEYFPEAGVLAVAAVWSAVRGSGPEI